MPVLQNALHQAFRSHLQQEYCFAPAVASDCPYGKMQCYFSLGTHCKLVKGGGYLSRSLQLLSYIINSRVCWRGSLLQVLQ